MDEVALCVEWYFPLAVDPSRRCNVLTATRHETPAEYDLGDDQGVSDLHEPG